MAAHLYVKNTTSTWSEGTLYIKVAPSNWQPADNIWVKTGPSTWEAAYSSTFQIDNTVEVGWDLTSGSATYSNNDLYQFYGTNYHFTPNPVSISANFKMFNPQSGTTTTLKTYSGLTNPSSNSSTRVPSTGYAYKLLQSDAFNRGGDTYITFGVTASSASGTTYTSTGSYTVRTPAAPIVTIDTNYNVSNQIKINWSSRSNEDYYATNGYIVYYYDNTSGTYIYGTANNINANGTGHYPGDYSSSAIFTGLSNSRTYSFYVLPITGYQGYTPTNYSGYLGAVGAVSTGTTLAPIANSSPSITGGAYPGGTVTVSNATWSLTPTSYTYDWYKSTDFQTYVSMGLTTQSITIPSNFVSSGYKAVKCYVTAYYNTIPSDPNASYPLEIISQQLVTPTLSTTTIGYSVYPAGYANVQIGNYYTAYTGNETWSASISPTLPVGSITKNQEFPEEWNFTNLTAGTTYTVTIYVARTGFTNASQTIQFTALPLVASKPTFLTYQGTSGTNKGYIGVYSNNASSVGWIIYRTTNGTGTSGYGSTYTYSIYDSGSFSGTGYEFYDLPRNGYYYMEAIGYNSQGTASATAYSNGTGQSGTTANYFYTGPIDAPTAGGGYASGSDAYLYWTEPVDYYNNRIGASIKNNVVSYEIYWSSVNSTPSSGATADYSGITGSSYTAPIGSATTRYYWIRSYSTSGNIVGRSAWVALGPVTITGVAPSGMTVSLAPSGTQMAGTTITATVSAATAGASPITYTVQIYKATGADPTNANTALESGTTSASHAITTTEASGTPDRFIAYATATNSYGTQTAYSNVVTSTPYVAPNAAPTGGTATVTPSTGTAGSTSYSASTSGWSGNPSTFTYTYSWQYFSSSSFSYVQYTTGSTFSPASNINTLYPNYGWQLVVTASNGISPNGTASTSFTVSTPAATTTTTTTTTACTCAYSDYGTYYYSPQCCGANAPYTGLPAGLSPGSGSCCPNVNKPAATTTTTAGRPTVYWTCTQADVNNPSNPCTSVGQCRQAGNAYLPRGCTSCCD